MAGHGEPTDGGVPTFAVADETIFVSYTHIDNEPFGPDAQCWVSHLHDQLTSRVAQLFGDRVVVWRDDKLRGNDVFPETLMEQLAKVDILVSVISPRYLNSEWCQRELDEFVRIAGEDASVGSKSRVFKVLKTPVPLEELPGGLDELLGYEFFEETDQQRVREFLLNPDPEQRWKFYARVDDLAQDIASLLREMEDSEPADASTTGQVIYLAEATSDVTVHRDDLRRELERHGHQVLPHRCLPVVIEELPDVVRAELAEADVSIHLLGNRYGLRPEGDVRSMPHIQIDLAAEALGREGFQQLIWIPDHVQAANAEGWRTLDARRVLCRDNRNAVQLDRESWKHISAEGATTPESLRHPDRSSQARWKAAQDQLGSPMGKVGRRTCRASADQTLRHR